MKIDLPVDIVIYVNVLRKKVVCLFCFLFCFVLFFEVALVGGYVLLLLLFFSSGKSGGKGDVNNWCC